LNSHSTCLQTLLGVARALVALTVLAFALGPAAADESVPSSTPGTPSSKPGTPSPKPGTPSPKSGTPEEVDARPGATGETEPAADPGPEVGLDKLLRLPNSFEADIDRRGGATASEWRLRFDKARGGVDEAKEKLVKAEKELDQISGSSTSWQVSAPGASDPQTSPLSLRLRQEVKDHRVEIEQAERELRSLDVAADLAAVPAEWRE
jgi:hypothetical protein